MGCMCSRETIHIGNGKYFVRCKLAEGGFSRIDLAEDSVTGKLFVLKRILCYSREDEGVALREVEYMKDIDHPNVVSYTGHMINRELANPNILSEITIVMPFYKRGTLQDLIDRGEYLDESLLIYILMSLCKGIEAFHKRGPVIAHRDIKPANVLLGGDNSPVLMDLGSANIARLSITNRSEAQQLEDEAAERCSMLFRPPELFQVESECEITEATDIWSLGCLLYALVYLESPFESVYQKGGSIALAAVGGNVTFPEQSRYSSTILDMIKAMLSVDPTNRPSIDGLIRQLQFVQNDADNRI